MGKNKSIRKYVASSIATASVLAVSTPVFAADIEDFSDVKVGSSHYDSIKALTEQGVVVGHTNTAFGVNDELERVHSAVMFARALDLDIPSDVDNVLDTYNDVNSGYQFDQEVAAVTEAGIFRGVGGYFNPEGSLTREQMATTIVKAFGLEDDGSDSKVNLNNVSPSHRDGVKILAQYGITNQLDDFRPREAVKRGQFATFLYKTQQMVEETKSSAKPAVEEITADNLKQIEITLTGNVNIEAAANADNYEIEDDNGYDLDFTVDVQGEESIRTAANSTKVVLTLDDRDVPDNQDILTVTVDKKVSGEEIEEEVEFFDSTIPEITEAEVIGSSTVKVSFSEPLAVEEDNGEWVTIKDGVPAEDAFDIEQDGSGLFVKSVSFVKNNTEANVELYSSFEEGELDLTIHNILEDYSDLNLIGGKFELDVTPDKEVPSVVGYKNATKQGVTLVFNEDIDLVQGATYRDFYHTNSNNTVDDEARTSTGYGVELDGNELTLSFRDQELPGGTAYVFIDGETILDKWDNVKESQLRVEIDVEVDETKPEVKTVESTKEDEIEITFSEELDEKSVDDDNFTLLDRDGDELDIVDDVDVDGDTVTVTFDEKLSGKHSIIIEDVKDLAGNELDETEAPFEADDATPIDTDQVTANLYNSAEDYWTLVVTYPEPMATVGKYAVNDLDNYQIDNKILSNLKNVDIDVNSDNTRVELKISKDQSSSFSIGESDLLTIARVADAAGNTTNDYSFEVPITDQDYVIISRVEATATDTLEVYFDDRVRLDIDDFTFSSGGQAIEPAIVASSLTDGKTVAIVKLSEKIAADISDLSVAVTDNNTENPYSEKLKYYSPGELTLLDKIPPELVFNSSDEAEVLSDASTNSVTLTFTEPLGAIGDGSEETSPLLAAFDFVITDEDGEELTAGTEYTVATNEEDPSKLVITLADAYADYDGTLNIEIDDPSYIKDVKTSEESGGNLVVAVDDVSVDVDFN